MSEALPSTPQFASWRIALGARFLFPEWSLISSLAPA